MKKIVAVLTTEVNLEVPNNFFEEDVENLIAFDILPTFTSEQKACKIVGEKLIEFEWNEIENE